MTTSASLHPLLFPVLRLLPSEGFRSGSDIAAQLGVSRGTVWQAVAGAEALGLKVLRLRGSGYRLARPLAWLDAGRVTRALPAAARRFRVQVLDTVESTNAALLARAAAGAPHGTVLAAQHQSAGRGRLGRRWQGVLGGSLAFSLLARFAGGPSTLSGLSLAVGLAVARALRAAGATGAALKWPNDVVAPGGKLAGVLIELSGDALGPTAAVIGVGVNLALPEELRRAIDQPVTDLASESAAAPEPNQLLATLLGELADILGRFGAAGFAPLRAEWEALHLYQGRPVALHLASGAVRRGTVLGVDEGGALRLAGPGGEERHAAGEISLRPAP